MVLPLRFGLVQPNLDYLEDFVMDVSHPESPNYGKHWSATKIAQTFRPAKESIETVHLWLVESGIDRASVRLSQGGGWLKANVTVEQAERLLQTEYHVYQSDEEGGGQHIACYEKYHLPEHVARHVDIVTPTLHFDTKPRTSVPQKIDMDKRDRPVNARSLGQPELGVSIPKTAATIETIYKGIEKCDEQIVPDCLRALYNFAYTPVATEKNSIAIIEYNSQAYLPNDLDLFFANFSPSQVGQRPVLDSIDGGYLQTKEQDESVNGESDLDLQYAMSLNDALSPPAFVIVASFNNLLDALDGSYCTFEGGDDPEYDAMYPDPSGNGYEGPEDCGTVTPAYVMSTSYYFDEAQFTPAYEQRQCAEYAKLGLMGTTVLYVSGDNGVSGGNFQCLDSERQSSNNGTIFNPSFPSTCPYVTSVGATQINPGASVYEPESACEQVIYSGGGFSNVFAMPSYQKTAVEHYLSNYPPPYSSAIYNTSGTSRAYPDISANGANYLVAIDGNFTLTYGTSCSSPVLAAFFSAINDARLGVGKGPIGFINPTIYSSAFVEAFNDITNGSNPGCNTSGFSAEPGWDPVTGVGTPNFPKLLDLWLALP
ncbi:hypothetical protein IEO21_08015 [Rhodonia placenta]|uniref:tripeptidyl-peptidase II n=1 Tax=Rhodonia placenta TaxID=104341 RepID=A0A8H7TZM0_9APHY|nr:hypothetical protein IEO21_08015 [Postia placenta]